MATIEASMTLRNGMTGPMKNINQEFKFLAQSMNTVRAASENLFDPAMLGATGRKIEEFGKRAREVETDLSGVDEAQQKVNQTMEKGAGLSEKLASGVKGIASKLFTLQNVVGAASLSDQMAQTTTRMGAANDGRQSTEQLNQMVFESAQRSGSSYFDTASAMSDLSLNGGAAFQNNEEAIGFVEQINKQFALAGASASQQSDAMTQMIQGMAEGSLQGERLNSILSTAPEIGRSIEQSMGWAEGSIGQYAQQGLVSAQVVKNAMLSTADETNAKFAEMPRTFSQLWTMFQNEALMKFQPVLQELNRLANGTQFQQGIAAMIDGLSILAGIAVKVFGLLAGGASFIYDNWSTIGPVFWGVVGALGAYFAISKASLIVDQAKALWSGICTAASAAYSMAVGIQSMAFTLLAAATNKATQADLAHSTAMKASPMGWILLLIGLIVMAIAQWVRSVGGLQVAWLIVMDRLASAFDWLKIHFFMGIYGILDGWAAMWLGINRFSTWIVDGIGGMKVKALMLLQDMVNGAIDRINDLIRLARNVTGASIELISHVEFGSKEAVKFEAEKQQRALELAEEETAYNNQVLEHQTRLSQMQTEAAKNKAQRQIEIQNAKLEAASKKNDQPTTPEIPGMEQLGTDMGATAANTGAMAQGMEMSGEDLKYLRDIAEREVINRFTTADLNITMNTSASINSELDIDGVISQLENKTYEVMMSTAEGV